MKFFSQQPQKSIIFLLICTLVLIIIELFPLDVELGTVYLMCVPWIIFPAIILVLSYLMFCTGGISYIYILLSILFGIVYSCVCNILPSMAANNLDDLNIIHILTDLRWLSIGTALSLIGMIVGIIVSKIIKSK